ncbi:unnamed protein product [Prorocentrum cordatum]|uniref:Uncharacterized protein n=1 Tax=Prorocentrum cordatum TaxID=2364126 RepID=A0ABN9TVB1_9DINO|nr:unnamed protein product [Polarella glacialis]
MVRLAPCQEPPRGTCLAPVFAAAFFWQPLKARPLREAGSPLRATRQSSCLLAVAAPQPGSPAVRKPRPGLRRHELRRERYLPRLWFLRLTPSFFAEIPHITSSGTSPPCSWPALAPAASGSPEARR